MAVEILWPLLSTWDLAMQTLPEADELHSHWTRTLTSLGLSMDRASEQESGLENLLDQVEGVLELWAERVGA